MSEENKNYILRCDSCGFGFYLSSVKIKESYVKVGRMKHIKLKYFLCPKCNEIYEVLRVDKKFEEYEKDLDKARKRLANIGESNDKKLIEMLAKLVCIKEERLKKYEKLLKAKFPGTFKIGESIDEIIYLP